MTDLPDPLTPRECDLRDYPWMPIDCTRLLTSETWLLGTSDQKVAALTLWMKSWHQVPAGSLPAHDKMLAALSEAGAAWNKVKQHVMRGWVLCSDGRLYHPVVCEKAVESWERKLAQKARTEKARQAKAAKLSGGPTDHPPSSVAISVTEDATSPATEHVTASVTEHVTASTRPDQTRQEKERKKSSVPLPREERPVPEPPPEPMCLPSSPMSVVGQVTARWQGRARGQPFLTPKPNPRTADEQLARLVPRVKAAPLSAEHLAEARERLRRRAAC